MEYKEKEIKTGIKLHEIKTEKFKTNLIAVFLTTELTRENVTKNAVISAILRRGSQNLKTQEEISKQMENLYGASFDCGLDKTGDNQVLKFYIETVNDTFLPKTNENILKTAIQNLLEIIFNPYTENDAFKKEYLDQEKNNIKQRIEGKKDNKAIYSLERCIQEMYQNEPFGLYKFGYIEDLEKINEKNLYEYYKKLIDNCKIDIFVSGNIDDKTTEIIENDENIKKLKSRNPKYNISKIERKEIKKEKIITDHLEVSQGKLVIGLDVDIEDENLKYDVLVYNCILGGTANSKLFQNVREKAHLAYVASSSYLKHKNNIFINCGIEISNYEKTLGLIKKQIEDIKNADFTNEEVENAKQGIIATIKTIDDEQDTTINYLFGQELATTKVSLDEYMKNIKKINKEDVVNIAKKVNINTIYFLRD